MERLEEVKCGHCGKDILVLNDHKRDKMFCTLGCMFKAADKKQVNNT